MAKIVTMVKNDPITGVEYGIVEISDLEIIAPNGNPYANAQNTYKQVQKAQSGIKQKTRKNNARQK